MVDQERLDQIDDLLKQEEREHGLRGNVVYVVEIDDVLSDQNNLMTDGAGLMSLPVATGLPALDNGRKLPQQSTDADDAALVVQSRCTAGGRALDAV